jgi:hypothetical protein
MGPGWHLQPRAFAPQASVMASGVRDDVSHDYTCFMRRGEDARLHGRFLSAAYDPASLPSEGGNLPVDWVAEILWTGWQKSVEYARRALCATHCGSLQSIRTRAGPFHDDPLDRDAEKPFCYASISASAQRKWALPPIDAEASHALTLSYLFSSLRTASGY